MNLKDLHDKICTTLKREIPAIQTCEIYPSIRKELLAPALFVELVSLESGKDPGTEELALKARFEARIVIDSTIENAPIIVRSLASEVAKVVNKNTWNVKNVSPGEFISGGGDDFRPELDAYLVWLVEWTHEVHVGKSVWSTGIMPHVIEIGEVHVIPSPVSNKTNEKELFLPITGELSKFITCSICLPNNEYWY